MNDIARAAMEVPIVQARHSNDPLITRGRFIFTPPPDSLSSACPQGGIIDTTRTNVSGQAYALSPPTRKTSASPVNHVWQVTIFPTTSAVSIPRASSITLGPPVFGG